MNNETVQQWLSVRRQLLDMEADFTSLAIKVANGQESEERLKQQRDLLEAARERCSAAFRSAFPESESAPR